MLVKYLAELGLSTHITVQEQAFWDDDAHAGLEDLILHGGEELPYVVKSPWLHEFVDEVLERDDIAIDGVIIPIRNLTDAASSRSIRECRTSIVPTKIWQRNVKPGIRGEPRQEASSIPSIRWTRRDYWP